MPLVACRYIHLAVPRGPSILSRQEPDLSQLFFGSTSTAAPHPFQCDPQIRPTKFHACATCPPRPSPIAGHVFLIPPYEECRGETPVLSHLPRVRNAPTQKGPR